MDETRRPSSDAWSELDAALTAEFTDGNRSLPAACTTLFHQAVIARDAGAYEAAALTCRSAVETAGWHYLYLTWLRTGWSARGIPRNEHLVVDQTPLSAIERDLFADHAIPDRLRRPFNKIKKAGDTAAHLAEVTLRAAEDHTRRSIQAMFHTGHQPPPPDRTPLEPVWVDLEAINSLLSDTASIILELFLSSAHRSRTESPERFV